MPSRLQRMLAKRRRRFNNENIAPRRTQVFAALEASVCVEIHSMMTGSLEKQSKLPSAKLQTNGLRINIDSEQPKAHRSFSLRGRFALHSKFWRDGKCSFRSLTTGVVVMISNANPIELAKFLDAAVTYKTSNVQPSYATAASKEAQVELRRRKRDREEFEQQLAREAAAKGEALGEIPSTQERARTRRRLAFEPSDDLTQEQKEVLAAVRAGENVFFTGGAGTGKTFTLHELQRMCSDATVHTVASTAIAACPLGGTTLHAFAGIGRATALNTAVATVMRQPAVVQRWRTATTLILDEISMIDGDLFDLVEAVARAVRGSTHPFGGIQLVLCGDFYQLPPASSGNVRKKYAFEANSWASCVSKVIQLSQVFRQDDADFVDALNEIRVGQLSDGAMELLNSRYRPDDSLASQDDAGVVPTKLMTHRAAVDKVNAKHLNAQAGRAVTFRAIDIGPSTLQGAPMDKLCRAASSVSLKVGSQVILTKTLDQARGLVNGARGVVHSFAGHSRAPMVVFSGHAGAEPVKIRRETWPVRRGQVVIATRKQIPLVLGWGITVHKSQGMSLSSLQVDLARVFESGQAYVALSRARTLDGLVLTSRVTRGMIRADARVSAFYASISAAAAAASSTSSTGQST